MCDIEKKLDKIIEYQIMIINILGACTNKITGENFEYIDKDGCFIYPETWKVIWNEGHVYASSLHRVVLAKG